MYITKIQAYILIYFSCFLHKATLSLTVHHSFASYAREEYHKLANMHKNMEKLYHDLMHYFVINPKKVTVEEVFNEISNFKSMFMVCLYDEAL